MLIVKVLQGAVANNRVIGYEAIASFLYFEFVFKFWKRDARNPCQLSYANRTPSAVVRSPLKQSSFGNALMTPWVFSLPYAASQLPSYTGSFA